MAAGEDRVQEGPRAEESDPARRLVQLAVVARRPEKKRKPSQPGPPALVPSGLRDYVLDGNTFLSKDDVTDNMLAIAGQTD